MAQFLGDIAFLLELGLVAAGLVLLHHGREQAAGLLRTAGWLLVVVATATAVCTTYFWFSYHQAGEFEHARAQASAQEMASELRSLPLPSPVARFFRHPARPLPGSPSLAPTRLSAQHGSARDRTTISFAEFLRSKN